MCSPEVLRQSMRVAALVVGWMLSIAGVASPWWRWLDEGQHARYEGLWCQCETRARFDTRCRFSERSSGLWRAIQVVKLTSLLFLTVAFVTLLVEIMCCTPRKYFKKTARICSGSCITALVGGLTGLIGDLLYVGYTEYHTIPSPGQHVYYWSFAWCVGGSCMSLFAALIINFTSRFCLPVEPPKSSKTKGRHRPDHSFYMRHPDGYTIYQPGRGMDCRDVGDPYRSRHPYNGESSREIHNPYVINESYRPHGRYPYQRPNRPEVVDDRYRGLYRPSTGDSFGAFHVEAPACGLYPNLRGSLPSIQERPGLYVPSAPPGSISEGPPGYVSDRTTPRTLESESRSQQDEMVPPAAHNQSMVRPIEHRPQATPKFLAHVSTQTRSEHVVPTSPGTNPSSAVAGQAEHHTRSDEEGSPRPLNLSKPNSMDMDDDRPIAVSTLRRIRERRHVDFERVDPVSLPQAVDEIGSSAAAQGFRPIENDRHGEEVRSIEKSGRSEKSGHVQETGQNVAFRRHGTAPRKSTSLPVHGSRYGQYGRWYLPHRRPGQGRMVIKARKNGQHESIMHL